jgi:hypothetical protein
MYICASNVAALIGQHKYRPREEALVKFWKRNAPKQYTEVFKSLTNNSKDREETTITELQKIDQNIKKVMVAEKLALEEKISTSRKIIESHLNETCTTANKRQMCTDMLQSVRKRICTDAGHKNESKGLNLYEKKHKTVVISRNTKLFKKCRITSHGHKYNICGKIDGIDAKTNTLIEHKHRMRRFFTFIPRYEFVQLYVYMFLTDLPQARLVQHFNKQIKNFDDVTFETEKWNDIAIACDTFIDDYYSFIKDTPRQIQLCQKYCISK